MILAEASTRTVERALDLLGAVCERGHASLAETAREADLPASTALRLLRTLEANSFLTRDESGDYRPGSRLIQLGAQAFTKNTLTEVARQPMQNIVDAIGESAYLSVEGPNDSALYISIIEGTHSVRHTNWVGRTVPLEGSAAGQVLRGEAPDEGFVVVQNSVEDDVTAISAPIEVAGRPRAALSVLVPTYRIDKTKATRYGQLLVQAAADISGQLIGN